MNTKSEFTVRKPVPEDYPVLFQMAKDAHAEGALMPINEYRLSEAIRAAIAPNTNIMMGVIGPIGNPEALICIQITCYIYATIHHLEEIANYVRPDFRRSTRARTLLRYAKRCARELGVPLLIGVLSSKRTKAKIRMYEKEFGEPVGAYFLYNGCLGTH